MTPGKYHIIKINLICFFFFRYIYKDLSEKDSPIRKKLFASFATFLFIYVWHGLHGFVLVWTILNYFTVHIEQFGRIISIRYDHLLSNYLTANGKHRFYAICAAQLYIVGTLSNFYFFAGITTGNLFIWRTYVQSSWSVYLTLSLVCYCLVHVSEVIKRREVAIEMSKNKSD